MAGRIQFTNGNGTEYIYTANGEQRTIHRTAVANMGYPIGVGVPLTPALTLSVDSTDYIGNFIFRNSKADKFLFSGGYCSFTSDNQSVYHYYTQDHLGNNRAVVNEDGTLEQVTHYYPFGDVYGDAGLNASAQPYKYNGKELDRMYRLDWYDYGARDYDAVVPMWTSVDPMAEKYYNISPYVYCENNPVSRVDPDGRIWKNPEDAERQASAIQDKITKLEEATRSSQKALENKDLTASDKKELEKRISGFGERIDYLKKGLSDIARLGKDKDHVYDIKENKAITGSVTRHKGIVEINGIRTGLFLHELKHIIQSLNKGGLVFINGNLQNNGKTKEDKIKNETESYRVQSSFNGSFDDKSIYSPSEVTNEKVKNQRDKKTGEKLYPY